MQIIVTLLQSRISIINRFFRFLYLVILFSCSHNGTILREMGLILRWGVNRKRGAQIRIDYYARSHRKYTCAQARTCACIIAGLHLLQFVYRPRGWFSYRQRPRPPAPPPIHNRSLMHGHVIIFPISSDRAARRFCMRPVCLL